MSLAYVPYTFFNRHFKSRIEVISEKPIRPVWVDSCHSAIARQSLIKRLLHPRGTTHLFYLVPSAEICELLQS
jgi:hypothetical protein